MKSIIDTNMIVRYLIHETEEEYELAKKCIDDGKVILPEVLAETIYVLEGIYKIPRKEIYKSLIDLLEDVDIENKEYYQDALAKYADSKLDYVDWLLWERNEKYKQKIYTFDRKLKNKLSNWERVPTSLFCYLSTYVW